ncbi:MAG: hypothetical protein V7L31_15655 [Nostoc sp.]
MIVPALRVLIPIAIIHEWHESAVAIASPELAAAFSAETNEVALTKPSA